MFSLSAGVRRVAGPRSPDRSWRVDLSAARTADRWTRTSRLRDLTVNAIAEPLAGGDLVDPHRRCAPTSTPGVLRMAGPGAFEDDPLRVVRVARLALRAGLRDRSGDEGRGARRRRRPRPRLRRARSSPSSTSCSRATRRRPAWPAGRRRRAPASCCRRSPRSTASSRTATTTSTSTATRSRSSRSDRPRARPGRRCSAPSTPTRCARVLAEPLADELTRGDGPALGRAAARRRQAARRGSCATTARSAASRVTTSRAPSSPARSSPG